MEESKFKIESVIKIVPENDNYFYAIQPDRDGLGVIEITEYYYDSDKEEPENYLCFTREEARLIANKLIEYCDNDENFKE